LGDEHTVEGIPVQDGQQAGTLGVKQSYRERRECLRSNSSRDVVDDAGGPGKLADSKLGRDLPRRRCAYKHGCGSVADGLAGLSGQTPITFQPPKEGMRVKEQTQKSSLPRVKLFLRERLKEARVSANLAT
jgi:hypothetical protein